MYIFFNVKLVMHSVYCTYTDDVRYNENAKQFYKHSFQLHALACLKNKSVEKLCTDFNNIVRKC